ncbi:hypothetical protein RvY_00762 [Ramazzottius varieornatus]|uniref:Uncharacterized protein n=1 Tax=Ramazzottius varieornatus TaxID=947166 RepID=A0A1D1UHX0_RAMVA|nr:hypothetical protein RvY_00762 [Ramazzottius varieornatus]
MLDTLQRIANATKKDGLLEVLVRRRERLFDQPVESVPAELLPPYMQQKMVDESKLHPSFAPRAPGSYRSNSYR